LKKIRVLADELELPVHMHVHETLHEVKQSMEQYGQRSLQRLHDLNLIDPSFIAVHMTQLNDQEIETYAQSGGHIVHCPESNLKLASGFCPLDKCINAGINVALGTDGAASNNDLDMLGEMRCAALLAKGVAQDPSAIPAHTALRMATLNGAVALGLDNEIGSFQIGKSADVTAINLDDLETLPVYDPITQIVYAAGRQHVTDVWVAGKQLLKQRRLTTINLSDLKSRLNVWRHRLSADSM
jgi:5-methylthioadenosine/S-adenosylhomocysteine deaminase